MDAKEHNVCKLEFELDEAEHVLASLSLTSILMGEYMVIMRVCTYCTRVGTWESDKIISYLVAAQL